MQRLFFILCICTTGSFLSAQIPIGPVLDAELLVPNTTNNVVQGTNLFLLQRERPLQETIKDVQGFFQKASTLVNGAVKQLRMVKEIVGNQKDIVQLYDRSLQALNGDGDNDFIDKWKHAQILLGLLNETTAVFELFENLITDDALVINDAGRLILLDRVYKDIKHIHRAMRSQVRRINQEIFAYKRLQREIETFELFFGQ